jgi:hypothetical protein
MWALFCDQSKVMSETKRDGADCALCLDDAEQLKFSDSEEEC